MLEVLVERKQFALAHRAGVHLALAGLSLSVATGELVCLVGPSGCGKSTLLNIINGLDRDMEGRVTLDGVQATEGIGTVFQNPRLMPWLTVLDNVCLVLDGTPRARRTAADLLGAMGLSDVLDAYPNRLSGGMQRRVALARAFATRPRLLLLDEPFVSLDLPVANRLREMLIELWQSRGAAVLFVTHDLREALTLGDRVLFMSASPGRVVLEVSVDLHRPRTLDDPGVVALKERLQTEQPDLLRGLVSAAAPESQRT
jgi:NitT/TauT family transport system ATP-binding protein